MPKYLKRAVLLNGPPDVMNTDQGFYFTATKWQEQLLDAGIKISMNGKDRWIDSARIDRFWRTIKYEDIYLQSYCSPNELE